MESSSNPGTNTVPWWQAALMIRGQTEVEQRNLRSVWIWCLLWGAGSAFVTNLIASRQLHGPIAWLLAMVPLVLGIAATWANIRFVREADEFMRKVQLEGIAIGFATGCAFCVGYFMLEVTVGAPHLPMIMALVPFTFGWAIGSLLVASRHR